MSLSRVKLAAVSSLVALLGVTGCSVKNDLPFFGDKDDNKTSSVGKENSGKSSPSDTDRTVKYLDKPQDLPKLAVPKTREDAVKQLSEFGKVEQGWWPDGSWAVWLNGDLKKTDEVNSCLLWKQDGTPGVDAVLVQLNRTNPDYDEPSRYGSLLDSPLNRDFRPYDKNQPCLGSIDWAGASPYLSPSNPRIDVIRKWNENIASLAEKARVTAFSPPNGLSVLDRIKNSMPAGSRVEEVDGPDGKTYKVFPAGVPAPAKVTIEQLPADSPAWNIDSKTSAPGAYWNAIANQVWKVTAEKPRPMSQLYPYLGFTVASANTVAYKSLIDANGKATVASIGTPPESLPGN